MAAETAQAHAALLLAGGFGRRFGSDKRKHRLPDGRPMLLATLDRYVSVFDHVAVVVREDDIELCELIGKRHPDVQVILCSDAHLGMGHSLAAGVRGLKDRTSICVALADMPYVRPETLQALIAGFDSRTAPVIVQPWYRQQPGHPVMFDKAFFEEMGRLQGDTGARSILNRHPDRLLRCEVDDPGVIEDIDTPT